jgi:hypothetical protein
VQALGIVSKWFGASGWAVIALNTSTGCAFILDFDEFERCPECRASVETADEVTADEVTTQHESPVDAGRPRCADEGVLLSEYLDFEPLEADVVLQSEVLTTATRVYHAAYVSNGDEYDVILRSFDTAGEVVGGAGSFRPPLATLSLSKLLSTEVDAGAVDAGTDLKIVAPASMVPTPGAAGGLTIYTAIAPAGFETADVVRIQLDATWPKHATPTWLTEIPNFRIHGTAGRLGPAAGVLATGEPFAVWQGCKPDPDAEGISLQRDLCNSTGVTAIYGHAGSRLLDIDELAEQGILEDLPAGSIRALSGGTQPAAVWAVSTLGNGQVNIRAGLPALQPGSSTELLQCDDPSGRAQWLSATPIWGPATSVSWTKDNSTAEATRVECLDQTCHDMARAANADAGTAPECTPDMNRERVFPQVDYLVHGVWTASNADDDAYTVAAFVERDGSSRQLHATVTQGLPDPNEHPLFPADTNLELTTSNPSKVVLSLQKYQPNAKRAVVAVGWVESGNGSRQTARLSALDLCLEPLNTP